MAFKKLKSHETVELILLHLAVLAVYALRSLLPEAVSAGLLLVGASQLLLLQGFVRDLWLLRLARHHGPRAPQREVTCMCLESTLGMAGILLGGVLALGFSWATVTMSSTGWVVGVGAIGTFGFLTKDYIIQWSPLALRKDPEHQNIVVRFR